MIHQFYFDDENVNAALKIESKKEEKSETELKLEKRLKDLEDTERGTFERSVNKSYDTRIKDHIAKPLKEDGRLSEYTLNKLIEDIEIEVRRKMFSEKAFKTRLGSMFDRAKDDRYSNDSKTRILNAALVRAKSLVPEVRKELLKKALAKSGSGGGKRVQSTNTNMDKRVHGKTSSFRPKSNNGEKKPLSDMDILRG